MRFAIITCSTKLSILAPPQIFSGDIPFKDISGWLSLRSNVVNYAKRPAKPQPQDDIGREFDDKLWSLIEECWSQEPSDRPTAATISLRLGGVDGYLVNPAEMYKKEIAALTEELARVKERSKAARQDLETELVKLQNSLARRELEQVALKRELDEERDLRKQVEKNAERIKSARQDLETELAKLRDSLEKRELGQAELKKDLPVDKERDLHKQVETDADELAISILRTQAGSGVSPSEPMPIVQKPVFQVERPSIPSGFHNIKNRTGDIYWYAHDNDVYFWISEMNYAAGYSNAEVNEHSPIIQVLKG
jgi:hypothetical protein